MCGGSCLSKFVLAIFATAHLPVSVHRTGTSMAAPFAAGFAALLLSYLAREDYKLYGRGLEVKDTLASVSSLSEPLASTGIVKWGQGTSPNAVLDWGMACHYVSGKQQVATDFSLTGPSDDQTQFEDVESYSPRSAGSARTSSMLVEFFRSAGSHPPQYFVSDLAPRPDYARAVSRGVDFGPTVGGMSCGARGQYRIHQQQKLCQKSLAYASDAEPLLFFKNCLNLRQHEIGKWGLLVARRVPDKYFVYA